MTHDAATHDPLAVPADAAPAPIGVRLAAEGIGSFLVVASILGTLLFAAHHADDARAWAPGLVALAAAAAAGVSTGLATLTFQGVSGGHVNPAVTVGLAAAGRFPLRDAWRYALAQAVGALFASTVIVLIGLFGPEGWLTAAQGAGFAANGWGAQSPAGFSAAGAVLAETLFTGVLVVIVLGASRGRAVSAAAAGLGVGLVFLVTVPIDGGGANPARSLAAAIYGGTTPLAMLPVFVVAPLVGAVLAGLAYRALIEPRMPQSDEPA